MILATVLLSFAICVDLPAANGTSGIAIVQASQSGQNPQPEKPAEQPPAATNQGKETQPAGQPAAAPCAAKPSASAEQQPPCKTSTAKKHHAHKTSDNGTGSSKTIVRHGSTSDPNVQLGPGVNPQQSSKQSQNAARLLASTDANLAKLGSRTLNSDQQETLKQVKSYMEQSKAAANDGDAQRAYNLALKANLLSSELVGH